MNKIFNFKSELKVKNKLSDNVYELIYLVPEDLKFTPGQFISARIRPTITRAYSIVEIKNNLLTLIIDIGPKIYGGIASEYFNNVKVGDITNLLGPYGMFGVKDTEITKCFISTGTGIAPFIPMIKDNIVKSPNTKIYNFFGVRTEKEDIALPYLSSLIQSESIEYIRCVSREVPTDKLSRTGRVTKVIPDFNLNWQDTEFYLCGNKDMIMDIMGILKELGSDKIYFEKFN